MYMATIPHSRSGMDPFQQALRKRKKTHAKAHAEAQRRYARTHRERLSFYKRAKYARKKAEKQRAEDIAAIERRKREEWERILEELHRPAPPLTFRDVLGY